MQLQIENALPIQPDLTETLDILWWLPPGFCPTSEEQSDAEITNLGKTQAVKSTGTQCHENPEQSKAQIR